MCIGNFSYLWNEKREDFVFVKTDLDYCIVDKRKQSMLLVEDEELDQRLISEMLKNGNKVYDDINQAYADV